MPNVWTLRIARLAGCTLLTIGAASCASHGAGDGVIDQAAGGEAAWSAYGYLNPGMTGEGEFIGAYARESDCRAAVDDWMSTQVVGNPVSGDCLPVDRR